jgi:hypothetical protein
MQVEIGIGIGIAIGHRCWFLRTSRFAIAIPIPIPTQTPMIVPANGTDLHDK